MPSATSSAWAMPIAGAVELGQESGEVAFPGQRACSAAAAGTEEKNFMAEYLALTISPGSGYWRMARQVKARWRSFNRNGIVGRPPPASIYLGTIQRRESHADHLSSNVPILCFRRGRG